MHVWCVCGVYVCSACVVCVCVFICLCICVYWEWCVCEWSVCVSVCYKGYYTDRERSPERNGSDCGDQGGRKSVQ